MKLRFECKKCNFHKSYEVTDEYDEVKAGQDFATTHLNPIHPEFMEETVRAMATVTQKYFKVVDAETGNEFTKDMMPSGG